MTDNTLLQQKLEQYSLTVKGQTPTSRAAEVAGYAAAAGAAIAMAGAADAAIIYSGIQNISVEVNGNNAVTSGTSSFGFRRFRASSRQFVSIDIDGGSADIGARAKYSLRSMNNFYGVGTTYFSYRNQVGAVAMNGVRVILPRDGAANLPLSFIIGPGGDAASEVFAGGSIVHINFAGPAGQYSWGGNFGNFPIGVTGFAGIQLGSGDYGWIRLRIDDLVPGRAVYYHPYIYPDRVTIIDWAYDDSGAPIHVADTGVSQVPEPSSLALLASGAAGVAAFRRRKADRRV